MRFEGNAECWARCARVTPRRSPYITVNQNCVRRNKCGSISPRYGLRIINGVERRVSRNARRYQRFLAGVAQRFWSRVRGPVRTYIRQGKALDRQYARTIRRYIRSNPTFKKAVNINYRSLASLVQESKMQAELKLANGNNTEAWEYYQNYIQDNEVTIPDFQ